MGFCVFLRAWCCFNQLAWIHEMSFTRWRRYTTARDSDCGYPRAVLRLQENLKSLVQLWPAVTVRPVSRLKWCFGNSVVQQSDKHLPDITFIRTYALHRPIQEGRRRKVGLKMPPQDKFLAFLIIWYCIPCHFWCLVALLLLDVNMERCLI